MYTAFGLQYRFAAAEVAAPSFKAKAISLVLAGGIAGGFLGPEASRWGKDLFAVPFLGSFLILSAIALCALAVQSRVHVPKPALADRSGGRPLSEIAAQPVFVVAALAAALGYGVMNLLMTATPLAMSFCHYPYSAAAFVIEWHVVGMYAPGFFTGNLIQRFGVLKVIIAGTALVAAAVGVALAGNQVAHFWVALVLLGDRLESHVYRGNDAPDRGLYGEGQGEDAGAQRLHRIRRDGHLFAVVGRADRCGGLGAHERGSAAFHRGCDTRRALARGVAQETARRCGAGVGDPTAAHPDLEPMTQLDAAALRAWVGKSETRSDVIDARPAALLSATLDRDDPPPARGDVLPPLWHWLYFLPVYRESEVGPDGHAQARRLLASGASAAPDVGREPDRMAARGWRSATR